MKVRRKVIGIVMLAMVAAGCSTTHQQGASVDVKEYTPPTSIYNILDSTALAQPTEEAVKAARQWRFRPGLFNGQPVAVRVTIELSFSIY